MRQPASYCGTVDAAYGYTSSAWCQWTPARAWIRVAHLQIAKHENTKQLKLPLLLHMKTPYQRERRRYHHDISSAIQGTRDYCGFRHEHTSTWHSKIPYFSHWDALEDGEKYLRNTVTGGEDCNAPKYDSEDPC